MRIKSELEILNPTVRKQIIDEIEGTENKARKHEAFKRLHIYKDNVDVFVIDLLYHQFEETTVQEMSYAISNISLVRKVIDKLSRVYLNGVDRSILSKDSKINEEATEILSKLEKELDFDTHMKIINRYLKLQRNTVCYIKPCPFIDKDNNKRFRVRLSPLSPYLYDVVEEFYDRTRPLVYIMSNFDSLFHMQYTTLDPGSAAVRLGGFRHSGTGGAQHIIQGDNQDQKIADKKSDEEKEEDMGKKEYIWWTDSLHFTSIGSGIIDQKTGQAVDIRDANDDRVKNPIGEMPFENFAVDQDNSFWATGGRDLVHGGILVNSLITNYHHIGVTQGYGQMFATGKGIPKNIPVGPSKVIIFEYEEGEPVPTLDFKNSGAPLTDLMQMVEMYVALLLTTNNLSTSGVATQLGGGIAAPSGIALMIDQAESREDVQDQRQIFIDKEKNIWRKASKWIELYTQEGTIADELKGLFLPEDFDLMLQFREPRAIMSEAEKLDNIAKRKDLGINKMVELIKIDQPNLSDEEAEEKLKSIIEEKLKRMAKMMVNKPNPFDKNKEDLEEDERESIKDEGDDKGKQQ